MSQKERQLNQDLTYGEHCQRMHQNKSRTARVNSSNFCHRDGTCSDGKTRAPITLRFQVS
jgi:hypothetical protein